MVVFVAEPEEVVEFSEVVVALRVVSVLLELLAGGDVLPDGGPAVRGDELPV